MPTAEPPVEQHSPDTARSVRLSCGGICCWSLNEGEDGTVITAQVITNGKEQELSSHSARVGSLLRWDQVTLIRELGRGAFGEVFLAHLSTPAQPELRLVAVKRPVLDRGAVKDFLREMELLSVVLQDAPAGILRCYGVGLIDLCDAESRPFLILEACLGGDLRSLVTRANAAGVTGVYNQFDALKWALQLASCLAYLHSLR